MVCFEPGLRDLNVIYQLSYIVYNDFAVVIFVNNFDILNICCIEVRRKSVDIIF